MKINRLFLLIPLLLAALLLPTAWRLRARPLAVNVSGDITVNTTWSKANNPYIVTGSIYIANGVTLTIEAGVIVKFSRDVSMYVYGNGKMMAMGSAAEPIIFTSLKDDTQGGDSNGDGTITVPQPGDWYVITGYGDLSTIHLQSVLIRYSSTALQAYGHLVLQDSTVEQSSNSALYVAPNSGTAPNITIERNIVRNFTRTGIYLYDHPGSNILISDNTIQTTKYDSAIELQKVTGAQVTNNRIAVVGDDESMRGILLQNVGENVILANNTITRPLTAKAYAGIEIRNSRPQLTGNHISGFVSAVLMHDGFPQLIPTYAQNDFKNNSQGESIAVTGILKTGNWVQPGGYLHYVQGTATVEENATLTLPAGSVIKFERYGSLRLSNNAQLQAQGTITEPIVLTSIKDDSYAGDSNLDGGLTVPQPSDWYGIDAYGSLSTVELRYVLVRFASDAIDAYGHLSLRDSTVEQNQTAVNLSPAGGTAPSVTIERTLIRKNNYGIYVSRLPSNLKIVGNALIQNSTYGLYNADQQGAIAVMGNWWGAANGPKHATANPQGLGTTISDRVNFTQWLTSEPAFVPIERPSLPANAPAAAPDAYEANDICSQAGIVPPDGSAQMHTFHAKGEVDWMQFSATAGTTYRIEVQTPADSLADVNLEIYALCNTTPTEAWQATFTPGVRMDFKASQTGTLYLRMSNFDELIYGSNVAYRLSLRPLQPTSDGGALILLAGRLKGTDRLQANIHHTTNAVYDVFKASGYADEKIYYLASDSSLPGWDAAATLANLQQAITSWAVDKVGTARPLTLYLMDHGGIDTFYVDGVSNQQLAPGDLNSWLGQLEASVPGLRITVIIEACHSGSFIEGAQRIGKAGRMIITSTNVQNVAYASGKGAQFSDRFLTALGEGYGIANSFWDAQYSVRRLYKLQEPWIDVNGNGLPNEVGDGAESSQHNPNIAQTPADTWAPYIVTAQAPLSINEGVGTLRAEVRDNKSVKRVWAAIYAPSYRSPTSAEELVPEEVPIIDLVAQGNHQFSGIYDNFSEEGLYQVAFYAEDEDGLKARLLVLPIFTGDVGTIFLPLIWR